MRMCSLAQYESPVAIGAFDIGLIAHLEKNAGVAERASAAVTGDSGIVHFDDFRSFDGHGYIRF
jgi:hypothetical protein